MQPSGNCNFVPGEACHLARLTLCVVRLKAGTGWSDRTMLGRDKVSSTKLPWPQNADRPAFLPVEYAGLGPGLEGSEDSK